METEKEEFRQESKFNAAISQLTRLTELWVRANEHYLAGRILQFRDCLDRIWAELAADSTKEEVKKQQFLVQQIRKVLAIRTGKPFLNQTWFEKLEMQFKGISYESKKRKKRSLLIKWLLRYEKFLRICQNSQGKGSSYFDESEEGAD